MITKRLNMVTHSKHKWVNVGLETNDSCHGGIPGLIYITVASTYYSNRTSSDFPRSGIQQATNLFITLTLV